MCLPYLEGVVYVVCRVGKIESEYQTDGYFIVFQPINEAPAEYIVVHSRESHSVIHLTCFDSAFGYTKQLLDSQRVYLRISALLEVFLLYEFFCQTTASTFGKYCDRGFYTSTFYKVFELVALVVYACVDTFRSGYIAFLVVQYIAHRESGVDVHSLLGCFGCEVSAYLAERCTVVTAIAHIRRMKRYFERTLFVL